MLPEMITDVPLRYGDQIVGTCDMLQDGSIHAHFNWSEIPTQIAELMRVGLVSDMSFAPTFIAGHPTKNFRFAGPSIVSVKKEPSVADYVITPQHSDDSQLRISRAIELVYQYVKDRLEKTDTHVTFGIDEVYPVWFCFVLGNWKALISTTLPDGMYYEVTYDKNNKETYIDAYKKFENVCVPDDIA